MKQLYKVTYLSPVGKLPLIATKEALVAVLWENDKPNRVIFDVPIEEKENDILIETQRQLGEYFDKKRTQFEIPLSFEGTDFQKSVWQQLTKIPYGETITYGQLAHRLQLSVAASRAVGAANGRNPISIIVPCHRVIGASGKLTGFAGGLSIKQHLLDLEGNGLF